MMISSSPIYSDSGKYRCNPATLVAVGSTVAILTTLAVGANDHSRFAIEHNDDDDNAVLSKETSGSATYTRQRLLPNGTSQPRNLSWGTSNWGTFSWGNSATEDFRLRLHWAEGFLWQEKTDEQWFCMACAVCDANKFDNLCKLKPFCEEDMHMALVDCNRSKTKKGKDWVASLNVVKGGSGLFGSTDGLKGEQIQAVASTSLCLERVGARVVLLKHCDSSEERQRWLGFHDFGQEMELIPFPGEFKKRGVVFDRCLTSHHHPREGERIYAEICDKPRRSNTNFWVTY